MEAQPLPKPPYSSLSSPSISQPQHQHLQQPPSQLHAQQQQPPLQQAPPLQAGFGRAASFAPVPTNSFGAATPPLAGQKRDAMGVPLSEASPGSAVTKPQESSDNGSFAKLFVGSVPKTITEEEVRPMFGEHGNVLEVALLKDKRTGQQQGCCFIKYSTIEEAERAIKALHNQQTLPGGTTPLQVRFADGERERLGALEHKLFVGCVNRQATEKEIEEIFAPYGQVDDVYIMRDEAKQSRGCAFVKYPTREMAVAAVNALNGLYVMRGCDQPLTVRFAEPKKVRTGDTRVGGPGFGPASFSSRPGYPPAGPRADYRPGSYGGGQGHPLGWHNSGIQGIRPVAQGASVPHDTEGTAHRPVGTPSPVGGIIGNSSISSNGLTQGLNTLGSLSNAASQVFVAGSSQHQGYIGASVHQSTAFGQHFQPYAQPSVTYSQQGSSYTQQPQQGSTQQPQQGHAHQQLVGGASILPQQQTAYRVGPSMHQPSTVYGQQLATSSVPAQQPQSQLLPSVQQQQLPVTGVHAVQSTQPVAMLNAQQQPVPVSVQSQSLLQTNHPRPMVQPMQQQQSPGFQSQQASQLSAVHATSQLYGPQPIHHQVVGQIVQGHQFQGQPLQLQQSQSQSPLPAQQHQIQPLQAQQSQIQSLQVQQHQIQSLQAQKAQSQLSQTQQHQGQPLQAQQHHVHQQSPQQQQIQQQELHTQQQPVFYQQMASVQQPLQQASWTAPAQQLQVVCSTASSGLAVACPWTEHTSPEGYKYYYNSTTGESKWEKPPELSLAEKQLQMQAQTQPQSQQQQQQQHSSGVNSQQYGGAVSGTQYPTQGLGHVQIQPVAGSVDQASMQQFATAQQEWAWKGRPAGT